MMTEAREASELEEQTLDDVERYRPYAAFIGQLDLNRIWLVSTELENRSGPSMPEQVAIEIESSDRWTAVEEGFIVEVAYALRFVREEKQIANLKVTFGILYDSQQPMTDTIFALFAENNLQLNAWPYLREYLSSTVSRMGWLAFTLPSLKIGTRRKEET